MTYSVDAEPPFEHIERDEERGQGLHRLLLSIEGDPEYSGGDGSKTGIIEGWGCGLRVEQDFASGIHRFICRGAYARALVEIGADNLQQLPPAEYSDISGQFVLFACGAGLMEYTRLVGPLSPREYALFNSSRAREDLGLLLAFPTAFVPEVTGNVRGPRVLLELEDLEEGFGLAAAQPLQSILGLVADPGLESTARAVLVRVLETKIPPEYLVSQVAHAASRLERVRYRSKLARGLLAAAQ